jgi:hypothetical protein
MRWCTGRVCDAALTVAAEHQKSLLIKGFTFYITEYGTYRHILDYNTAEAIQGTYIRRTYRHTYEK